MTEADGPNAAQAGYWSSDAGRLWIDHEEALDRALEGVLDALLAAADPRPGEAVLDLGCGTGASTLALARAVSPGGSVTALDISEPLLARARDRLSGEDAVRFVRADAQTHDFGAPSFGLVASRFGVMFFSDPVAAFANLARAMRPGGRFVAVAWAGMDRNPWFRLPREAAVARLGAPPPTDPLAPGPLAFADRERAEGLLRAGGLSDVTGRTMEIDLTPPGDVAEAARLATQVGPAARVIGAMHGSPTDAEAIAADIARTFTTYERDGAVRVPATVHLLSARRTA